MKRTYDYYEVNIPHDCSSDPEERGQLAFITAEVGVRIYALPCVWKVLSDDGETVKVCRIRNKRPVKA